MGHRLDSKNVEERQGETESLKNVQSVISSTTHLIVSDPNANLVEAKAGSIHSQFLSF